MNLQSDSCIGRLSLYNPNQIEGSFIVKVPVGDIATQGLINWQHVRLVCDGKYIPFSIQDGQAHWKDGLESSRTDPRAEDLLTFSIVVPSRKWMQINLVPGRPKIISAVARKGNNIVVSYPNFAVGIDAHSGMLTSIRAFGDLLLSTPLSLQLYKVGKGVSSHEGIMGVAGGYNHPNVSIKKMGDIYPTIKLLSLSSNQGTTEINFDIHHKQGLDVLLTYRVYPNCQIEILSDGRPWTGDSPWLKEGLQFNLGLKGSKELLPDFQTYFPFYGYKDYSAIVNSVGSLFYGDHTMTFELGEESINGRFWHRQLAIYPTSKAYHKEDILESLTEGLVIKVLPYGIHLSPHPQIIYPNEIKSTGEAIADKLRRKSIAVKKESLDTTNQIIKLKLANNASSLGINGDGFQIQPLIEDKGVEIVAGTTFGLFKGSSLLTKYQMSGDSMFIPLISQNPVVDLRAGCFNGFPSEVDFPYENDSVWKHTLSDLIASGMNIVTAGGMASNWQMPVYFKYMPALQSSSPNEFDPVSGGVAFSQTSEQRKRGLDLLHFANARGEKVWLFFLVGAVPTTFAKQYPQSMLSDTANDRQSRTPRFISPEYQKYLHAYFKELLETYPIDGFVLIRDDNGGVDSSKDFKKYIAKSKTKDPVWEQYLKVYDILRSMDFKGDIAVYPYDDLYEPKLDSFLPKDMIIVGHGSGLGVLTRDFSRLGTMGDTWLDNLYQAFRVPSSVRIKRLLSDRGSYWAGGAYKGMELPWQAIGYFGWQPSATVNTFRYEFGEQNFGIENALNYVLFSRAYEHLWEVMEVRLMPNYWIRLSDSKRKDIAQQSRRWLVEYYQQLNKLEANDSRKVDKDWFTQVALYGIYFNYHLRRLELLIKMENIVLSQKQNVALGHALPDSVRNGLIEMNDEVYALAYGFDRQVAQVPGKMMESLRSGKLTLPFKEWIFGYDHWLDSALEIKAFSGSLKVSSFKLERGRPFQLQIELRNNGCMPWVSGVGQEISLTGDYSKYSLPAKWTFEGVPMVFGDKRIITLHGVAPMQPGTATIKLSFNSTILGSPAFLNQTISLNVP